MPDHVRGLWYIVAAIAYPVAVVLSIRWWGWPGLIAAFAAYLVVQVAVVEPAERRRRRTRGQ